MTSPGHLQLGQQGVGTAAEESGANGAKAAEKGPGTDSFGPFGFSATHSVARNSNWIFGSSMLESQKDNRVSEGQSVWFKTGTFHQQCIHTNHFKE